jgi:hypothetical protein
MRIVRSQPALTPRFSAAIDSWRIQALQTLHGFIVPLLDLLVDRRAIRHRTGASGGKHRAGRQGRAEESSP